MRRFLTLSLSILLLLCKAHSQDVLSSQRRAVALYPDLQIAGSPLHAKFLALYQSAKQGKSPALDKPDWPVVLAEEAAKSLRSLEGHFVFTSRCVESFNFKPDGTFYYNFFNDGTMANTGSEGTYKRFGNLIFIYSKQLGNMRLYYTWLDGEESLWTDTERRDHYLRTKEAGGRRFLLEKR